MNYRKDIEKKLIETYYYYKEKQKRELYQKEVKIKVVDIGESITRKKKMNKVEEM